MLAVDLELRALVCLDRVLDRELVQVELPPDGVELVHRSARRARPRLKPPASTASSRSPSRSRTPVEPPPVAVDGAVDDHASILTVYVPPMRTRARAVVIGGGVGGCSILYWLARLGWDDVVSSSAPTSPGLHVPLGRARGQLRGSLSLTRMMMSSRRPLPRARRRGRARTGWREVGSLRLASSPERLEEIAARRAGRRLRAPARADLRRRGAGALPADVDRRRPRGRVPADGRLHRSERSSPSRSPRARGGAGPRSRRHARDGDRRPSTGRVAGVVTDKGEIEAEVVVNAGGMFAARDRGAGRRHVPIVPMAHEYLVTQPGRPAAGHADDARPVAARLLPARVGRPDHGRLRARPAPWSLDGIRPTSTASCSRRTGPASRS